MNFFIKKQELAYLYFDLKFFHDSTRTWIYFFRVSIVIFNTEFDPSFTSRKFQKVDLHNGARTLIIINVIL